MLEGLESASRYDIEDAFEEAEAAAAIMFHARDLEHALAAWDTIIAAAQRLGYEVNRYGRDRTTYRMGQRARVLDHLDLIDEARAAYADLVQRHRVAADAADVPDPAGAARWVDHLQKSVDRLDRKIAKRDAGKSYARHRKPFDPELLEQLRREWYPQRAETMEQKRRQRQQEERDVRLEAWLDEHPDQRARLEAAYAKLHGALESSFNGGLRVGGDGAMGIAFVLDPTTPEFRDAATRILMVIDAFEQDDKRRTGRGPSKGSGVTGQLDR